MINTVIMMLIAVFMLLGIFDKVFLGDRLGYGKELESGIMQVGGLILSLVGIMVLAPFIGTILTPVVSPIYHLIGADPANFPGIIIGPDGGAFALASTMTNDPRVIALSGLFLSSMLGVTVCFSLPVSMGMVSNHDRLFLSKGMLAGIISTPFGALISGIIGGLDFGFMIRNLIPAFVIVALLSIGLIKAQNALIKGFLLFSKGITKAAQLSLGFASFEYLTGIKLIPGLDIIGDKFTVVGTMGITIGGALCAIRFINIVFKGGFARLGNVLKINDVAVLGIISSIANAIPVYSMVKDMDKRGKILTIAFSVPACYALGSHLAYSATVMPEYMAAVVAGKIICGVLAMIIAYVMFIRNKSLED